MAEVTTEAMLLQLGQDLEWPPVMHGRRKIVGADAWRAVLPATTPQERILWLRDLGDSLLGATPHSRERLQAWCRSPVDNPGTAEWLKDRVLFAGDHMVLEYVIAALLRTPECVRDFVVEECCFLAVGADSYAWIGSTHFVDRDGRDRPRMVFLSGADPHLPGLTRAILHELGHAWTTPTPSTLISTQGEAGFLTYMKHEGLTERLEERVACDERVAHALAVLWDAQGAASEERS